MFQEALRYVIKPRKRIIWNKMEGKPTDFKNTWHLMKPSDVIQPDVGGKALQV